MSQELIDVEVAYALPEHQAIVAVQVPAGTTALDAARQSNIGEQFPDLTLDESSRLGVFGQIVAPTLPLRAGDRVEIYRPLQADPKEVRKARAARARARRAGETTPDTGADNAGSVTVGPEKTGGDKTGADVTGTPDVDQE